VSYRPELSSHGLERNGFPRSDGHRSARQNHVRNAPFELITCGRYDELTPTCAETLHRGIPKSELHIFEQSAHMAHLEETERYLQVGGLFLGRAE
jgi:pimeloyl-ACP methyl ester carboxylesterase